MEIVYLAGGAIVTFFKFVIWFFTSPILLFATATFLLSLYYLGGAAFVFLGFWEDDDGVKRWHPSFFIFTAIIVSVVYYGGNYLKVFGV